MLIGGGILLFLLMRPSAPMYRGRTITAWLDDGASLKAPDWREAIQHIGTNALPYVVRNLALNDSRWRNAYSRLQSKLPNLLQRLLPKTKPLLTGSDGLQVFYDLKSNSIPFAIALLKHNSPTVRQAAAEGLGELRRQSTAANQGIPALTESLRDKEWDVRWAAARSLGIMGADASNAVPALAKIVADRGIGPQTNVFFCLRAVASHALGKIGPASASALPALKAALLDPSSYLRCHTAVAIWRIAADVDTALPVLLRDMPRQDERCKWDLITALGEMGPRAKQAVPQLRYELVNDEDKWTLKYVTNAFKKIDPDAAREAGVE